MSASAKKRRRSSLAPFKVKHTDSPGEHKDGNENKESDSDSQKKSLLPNPDNIAMDELIQVLEGRITRLKTEENDWKDYLKQLDDEIAESESRTVKPLSVDDIPMTDEMVSDYLYPMTDLNDLAKQVKEEYAKSLLLAAEHERGVHRVEQRSAEMESQYENWLNTVQTNIFQDLGSPRAAIQTFLDLPSTTPEGILTPP